MIILDDDYVIFGYPAEHGLEWYEIDEDSIRVTETEDGLTVTYTVDGEVKEVTGEIR